MSDKTRATGGPSTAARPLDAGRPAPRPPKRRSAAAAPERAMLAALLDRAPGGLAYLDRELTVLVANRAYAWACGRAPDTVAGRSHPELFGAGPDRATLERVRDTGRPAVLRAEPAPDGQPGDEPAYWDWAVEPVVTEEGRVEALIVSFTDATERERLVGQARAAALGLESARGELRVKERDLEWGTEELQVSAEELRLRNDELLGAQQALELERRRYQDLFELAPGGYLVTDAKGIIREANRGAGAMLGVAARWLDGKPLALFVTDRPEFLFRLAAMEARPDPRTYWELELRPRRGAPFPAGAHVAAAHGLAGTPEGLRWLLQDISAIKAAEARREAALAEREAALDALRLAHDELERRVDERTAELRQAVRALTESEERFRQMADTISEVFWMLDARNGRLLYISPAVETLTGVSLRRLYENPAAALDLLHPADRERLAAQGRDPAADGFSEQVRIVRADGAQRWVHVRGYAVRAAQGETYRLAGIAQDVTERVAAYELLEQRVARRTRELSTLLEISRHVALSPDLPSMLGLILEQLQQAVGCDSALIWALEGEALAPLAYLGRQPEERMLRECLALPDAPIRREALAGERQVVLRDERGAGLADPLGRPLRPIEPEARCWLALPLSIQDRAIGLLELSYDDPHNGTTRQVDLAAAFAGQAAVAIENARLYRQGRELAAMEERQRLARDLHDAVSQTLFSANLIAEVLPRLWDRNPEAGRRSLDELHELNRGALAEMRSLLLELRPASLLETDLAELLRMLGGVVTGRSRIPVSLDIQAPCRLPPDVQINLYRLAQEALHNVAKHSAASRAGVRLRCWPGQKPGAASGSENGHGDGPSSPPARVELSITDDGRGFEPERVAANSLGLDIMRERAAEIDAALDIESEPGSGTRVTVVWPGPD